jgi:hypothetical protein
MRINSNPMKGGNQSLRSRQSLRSGAWLALLAVWLQAVIPAVHHPAGMALAGGFSAVYQSNLCHAPAPAAPGDPGKGPAQTMPACALCQALHAIGGFAPPSVVTAATFRVFESIAFAAADNPAAAGRRLRDRQQPRAPPVLV